MKDVCGFDTISDCSGQHIYTSVNYFLWQEGLTTVEAQPTLKHCTCQGSSEVYKYINK
jgi:hypothetical protein